MNKGRVEGRLSGLLSTLPILFRAPGRAAFRPGADVDEISDDVFESQEKESPYMFPDRPPAEKE